MSRLRVGRAGGVDPGVLRGGLARRVALLALLGGGAVLAGCSSATSSTATTVASASASSGATSSTVVNSTIGTVKWVATNHGAVTALAGDVGALASSLPAAVSAKDTASVTAGCTTFATDVAAARALPPIPNASAEQAWSSLLTTLASASRQCTDGVSGNDTAKLTQAAIGLGGAGESLQALERSLGM
jgi:hypothetical protein